ncbi:type II toxin-antitoxin system RelE/ParE family toxin [Microvirga puerhi]|uniref:Type II toxin-antitoxin system RelE/ParE family toxin n=1 Tax=Microvirga puerhi TaxID=2876078 RepID=A0ABS7VV78_9HYPH|nr:type II toxin-antitoxin system RelE/ParE family toxin [Microvirga puerhi]MBZ6078960.1 type II toxin-antitoxin system RelE/ParE family toxin [Microvirga puerhi]
MRLYKPKDVAKQARKNKINDEDLCEAIARAEKGLIDAEVGRFLIKQRIGRKGDYRTIIVLKRGDMAVFLHIFPKGRKANLTQREEKAFRDAAKSIAGLESHHVEALVSAGEWIEIEYEQPQKDISERSASISPSGDEGPPPSRRDRQGDDAAL